MLASEFANNTLPEITGRQFDSGTKSQTIQLDVMLAYPKSSDINYKIMVIATFLRDCLMIKIYLSRYEMGKKRSW